MTHTSKHVPRHAATLHIQGDVYIPVGLLSDPHMIVPDEVVTSCAQEYKLAAPGLRGLDPMCGVGTIPRVISAMGGLCDAIDIDPHHHAIAKRELPISVKITLGDCLNLPPPAEPYDYIYTSVPFGWFEPLPHGLGADLATAFRRLLKPEGMLLLDSDDETKRDGRTWPLAKAQIDYFTYHGFRFDESRRFIARSPKKDQDTTFTELKFSMASMLP